MNSQLLPVEVCLVHQFVIHKTISRKNVRETLVYANLRTTFQNIQLMGTYK